MLVDEAALDWSSAVVVLERTMCLGNCPIYSVALSAGGEVSFHGAAFVSTCGNTRARVPPHQAERVFAALRNIHFLDVIWDTQCGFRLGTDSPSAILTLKLSAVERTISDYLGDDCSPKQLRLIEELIDLVTDSRQWMSCGPGACCTVCPGETVGTMMLRECQ